MSVYTSSECKSDTRTEKLVHGSGLRWARVWWWHTSCMNFSAWFQPLTITLSPAGLLTQVRWFMTHSPNGWPYFVLRLMWFGLWNTLVHLHLCLCSSTFKVHMGYRWLYCIPVAFNLCFASSFCQVVAHMGIWELARHFSTLPTESWGLSIWLIDFYLAWKPSPDCKWLKNLHHNILAGCIIFLESFTRRFGRKGTFLKMYVRSRLKPLLGSICSEKLCVE